VDAIRHPFRGRDDDSVPLERGDTEDSVCAVVCVGNQKGKVKNYQKLYRKSSFSSFSMEIFVFLPPINRSV
jgi:hypothetical protein